MKKLGVIIVILMILFFGFLYVTDHIRMKNNEPVVFSTWGMDYAPPEGITPDEAIETTRQLLDEKSSKTIINIDNPKVEEVVFDKSPSIYLVDKQAKVVGRKLYRITYNTQQDGLLGPIVFYIDKLSGKHIGMDYRE